VEKNKCFAGGRKKFRGKSYERLRTINNMHDVDMNKKRQQVTSMNI
jgi:hypothetical protein